MNKLPHAQEVNVLNVEEMMADLLTIKYASSKQGRRWLETSVRRELTDPASSKRTLNLLHMISTPVVTPRENRIMQINCAHKNVVQPEVVIVDLDDPRYPWLARALERGDNVVHFGVTENTRNKIEHLIEVLNIRFRQDLDPSKLTVERVVQESDAWQKELEREVSLREGEVLSFGVIDGKHEAVMLLDKQAFRREGLLMHHCVGDYEPRYGKAIVSIRKEGESIATIELNYWKDRRHLGETGNLCSGDRISIVQIRGPSNSAVPGILSLQIDGWLRRTFHIRDEVGVDQGSARNLVRTREEEMCIKFCQYLIRSFPSTYGYPELRDQIMRLMECGDTGWFHPHPSFSELVPDERSEFRFNIGSYTFSYRERTLSVRRAQGGPPLQRRIEDDMVVAMIIEHGCTAYHRDMGPEAERRIRNHTEAFNPLRATRF